MQRELKRPGSPEGIAKKGAFRRAWNHLTDFGNSPVLRILRARKISGLVEKLRAGGRMIEDDPFLGRIVDTRYEQKIVGMGKRAVPAMVAELGNAEPAVRSRAATMLGRIGDAAATLPLIEALWDRDEGASSSASAALTVIAKGNPKDVAHAIVAYVNEKGGDRLAATDTKTGWIFGVLHNLMTICGEAMENATA